MMQKGFAGFADESENKKASDIYIELTIAQSGGINIDLKAQFEPLFGTHIKAAITKQLQEMQIDHAQVRAVDFGALDFMIRARVKSAVDMACKENC